MNANEINRSLPLAWVQSIEEDVPALKSLLDSGVAWLEHTEVVGKASDGVEVSLGSILDRRDRLNLASYLKSNPSPESW